MGFRMELITKTCPKCNGIGVISFQKKGHGHQGVRNNAARYNKEEVLEIRRLHALGVPVTKIAVKMGGHSETVRQVVNYITYKDVF